MAKKMKSLLSVIYYAPRWLSYPTRARGIIVKYTADEVCQYSSEVLKSRAALPQIFYIVAECVSLTIR